MDFTSSEMKLTVKMNVSLLSQKRLQQMILVSHTACLLHGSRDKRRWKTAGKLKADLDVQLLLTTVACDF